MNRFTVELITDTHYQNELIVDRIILTPKLLNAKVRTDAPIHLLKDIAAQQLSKKIVDLMNHRSVSDLSRNSYYEEFSFTYAGKDELDIMKQQLKSRTIQLEISNNELKKAEEYLKNITEKYIKPHKQVKFKYVVIGMLSASIFSFIISTLGAN